MVLVRLVAIAALGIAAACGTSNRRSDDLGYDPALRDPAANAEPLFDAHGLPLGRGGVPLRAAAVEGEWRTFRGNTERSGTRLARGVVTPTILWSAPVGIQGYANTPLVTAEAVFLSSQGDTHDASDPSDGFYAIDPVDGSQLWFFGTGEDINGASLGDILIYGGSDAGTLYAVTRDTGRLAWSAELGDPINHGPLIVGARLYLQRQDGVSVIDAATGALLEILSGSDDGWDVRGALAADETHLVRTSALCRLDAWRDGTNAWSANACTPSSEDWVVRSNYAPVGLIGGAVLALVPEMLDHSGAELELSLRDERTGDAYWSTPTERTFDELGMRDGVAGYDLSYHASVPWVMNGTAFVPLVTAPYVVGFDLATGAPRTGTRMSTCRSRQFASIVGVPSRGYFARHDGNLYGFSPVDGSITWSVQLEYQAATVAGVPAAGGLVMGFEDNYCSADPWDGTALFSTPAIGDDGVVYVGSGEGFLYAIGDVTW